MDTQVILVKEFRSAVNNSEGFIEEIPGGSSIKDGEDNIDVIHDEILEEIGVDIDENKIIFEESRQIAGTILSTKSHLYSVELDEDDMNKIYEEAKTTHGVISDTELTYIEVRTLQEILENQILDWANIGKILSILTKKYKLKEVN